MWESLQSGDGRMPGEQQRAAHYAVKLDKLAKALGVPPSLDAAILLLTLIGLGAWPTAVPHTGGRQPQDVIGESLVHFARALCGPRQSP